MKYFIVTDVHSCYDELIQTLTAYGFDIDNDEHHFVSCGDLLDRGPKPLETLKFVTSIPTHRRHFVYGNHEELMESMIKRNYPLMHDYHNGTAWTVAYAMKCFDGVIDSAISKFAELLEWKRYISECVNYIELGDFICVHGWIPCAERYDHYYPYDNWKEHPFESCRWYNGMNAWLDGVRIPGKTIVCGHMFARYGHRHIHEDDMIDETKPFIDDGIIAMDSRVFRTHKLNCLIIET